MATVTETPPRRRASIGSRRNPETEAAVMAAARGLLAEQGYGGFSIEEVARRAGAGKPTIYRWWPSKSDLLIAVYDAEAAALRAPDLGELVRDLSRHTIDLWRFWRSGPAGAALCGLIADAQGSGTGLEALRERFLAERLAPVRAIFARAAGRGEIKPAEVEDRLALWVGFNWVRLLSGRIEDDAPLIRRTMKVIAGST